MENVFLFVELYRWLLSTKIHQTVIFLHVEYLAPWDFQMDNGTTKPVGREDQDPPINWFFTRTDF